MNKYILINESLANIDVIARKYIDYCKLHRSLEGGFIGTERERREAEIAESFRRNIATPANDIRFALIDFLKADSKDKPMDVNNQAAFNVGNVLATRDGMDYRSVFNLIMPFAADKQAIAFLKSMARDEYKGFVDMFSISEEELKAALDKMNRIFELGVPCVGEISDVRRIINKYAKANGYDIVDKPSAEFNELRLNRLADFCGVALD